MLHRRCFPFAAEFTTRALYYLIGFPWNFNVFIVDLVRSDVNVAAFVGIAIQVPQNQSRCIESVAVSLTRVSCTFLQVTYYVTDTSVSIDTLSVAFTVTYEFHLPHTFVVFGVVFVCSHALPDSIQVRVKSVLIGCNYFTCPFRCFFVVVSTSVDRIACTPQVNTCQNTHYGVLLDIRW